jgi:hypothetical protein
MLQTYTSFGKLRAWPAAPLRESQPNRMTNYDPIDPTAVWFIEMYPSICDWRVAAIQACLESIRAGHPGLEAWLTAVNDCVRRRTGEGLEKVASQWRTEAVDRSRAAYESGNWEAAATELVYYVEEVVCIHQRELQTDRQPGHCTISAGPQSPTTHHGATQGSLNSMRWNSRRNSMTRGKT